METLLTVLGMLICVVLHPREIFKERRRNKRIERLNKANSEQQR